MPISKGSAFVYVSDNCYLYGDYNNWTNCEDEMNKILSGISMSVLIASSIAGNANATGVVPSTYTSSVLIGNKLPDVIPFALNNGIQLLSRAKGMEMVTGSWVRRYSSRQYHNTPDLLRITQAKEKDISNLRRRLVKASNAPWMFHGKFKNLDYLLNIECSNRWSAYDMSIGDFTHWNSYRDKLRFKARTAKTKHERKSILGSLYKTRKSFFHVCRLGMKNNNLLTVTLVGDVDKGKVTDLAIESTMLASDLSGWQLRDTSIVNNTLYKGHYGLDLRQVSDLRLGKSHLIDIINDHQILIYEFKDDAHNGFAVYDRVQNHKHRKV